MLSTLSFHPSFDFLVIPTILSGLALLVVLLVQRTFLRKTRSRRRGSPRVASFSNLAALPDVWLTTERNNCEIHDGVLTYKMHAVVVTDKGVKITVNSTADADPAPRRSAAYPLRGYTDAISLAGATSVIHGALNHQVQTT